MIEPHHTKALEPIHGAVTDVAEIMTGGAKKHGNYAFKSRSRWYYYWKALKHLVRIPFHWYDLDSGYPHLAHAITNLLLALQLEIESE